MRVKTPLNSHSELLFDANSILFFLNCMSQSAQVNGVRFFFISVNFNASFQPIHTESYMISSFHIFRT